MNYLEKDVETAFIEWLQKYNGGFRGISCLKKLIYLDRQVRTPIGVIDALFWDDALCNPIVVEVKRGPTPKTVLSQLMAYMNYVQEQIVMYFPYIFENPHEKDIGVSRGIVVAESLDDQTKRAISTAYHLSFVRYEVSETGFNFYPVDLRSKDYPEPKGIFYWMHQRVIERSKGRILGGIKMDRLYFDRDGTRVPPEQLREEFAENAVIWPEKE